MIKLLFSVLFLSYSCRITFVFCSFCKNLIIDGFILVLYYKQIHQYLLLSVALYWSLYLLIYLYLLLFGCSLRMIIGQCLYNCYPYRIFFPVHCRTPAKDAKFTRICERIANFEQHIKELCESALKMRKERPLMVFIKSFVLRSVYPSFYFQYLMVGAIFLAFIAFCGQRVDNLLLSYLTSKIVRCQIGMIWFCLIDLALTICLVPGIRNRQLIPFVRQQLIDFWNNKKGNSTKTNVSISSSTPKVSSVKASAVVRPTSSTTTTHTLYSTTAYGSNKTKAQ